MKMLSLGKYTAQDTGLAVAYSIISHVSSYSNLLDESIYIKMYLYLNLFNI